MKTAIFGTKPYDRQFFEAANKRHGHDLTFLEARLERDTVPLARGYPAVCVFVNDVLDREVLERLADGGTRTIALRCAGYNNIDLRAARDFGLTVVRVPAYSPHAVAEYTIGLIIALDRNIHRAWSRVREDNFSLDGLVGHNIHGRTVGVIGTGRIGGIVARIFKLGFGCQVLACDPQPDTQLADQGIRYVAAERLMRDSDIVTLHCPLTPETHHIIDRVMLDQARPNLLLVNTSRGALIDTFAVIAALKARKLAGLALDVYEQEGDLFFEDLSNEIIQDDHFQRLLTFPNVLITGHQAFLTEEALLSIAETTLANLHAVESGADLVNAITAPLRAS